MKTVLFEPGFQDDIHSHDYPAVLKTFEDKGYKTKFVPINWRYTTPLDWLKELNQEYAKHDPKQIVLAGFSFGAVTAFLAAAKRNPSELWLCSLSPYFEGDNPKPVWLKYIGKRRAKVFADIDFPKLAMQINCPTKILYGELETDELKRRADKTHALIKNSKLIEVSNAPHDIAVKNYIKALSVNLR